MHLHFSRLRGDLKLFLLISQSNFKVPHFEISMAQDKMRAAILVVSDTASVDPSTDKCIPVLKDVFGDAWEIVEAKIVPDDIKAIQEFIKEWTDSEEHANCIVTSGGTGFAVKDKTPEDVYQYGQAVSPLIEKHAPGLM